MSNKKLYLGTTAEQLFGFGFADAQFGHNINEILRELAGNETNNNERRYELVNQLPLHAAVLSPTQKDAEAIAEDMAARGNCMPLVLRVRVCDFRKIEIWDNPNTTIYRPGALAIYGNIPLDRKER